MTIRVAVGHRTSYRFDRPINVGPHQVRLRPAPHTRTPILGYGLRIEPADHFINWQQDPFGNFVARVVVPERTTELSFEVELIADMTPINPFDFFLEEDAEQIPFAYSADDQADLAAYLEIDDDGPLINEFVAQIDRTPQPTMDVLVDLNRRVLDAVTYGIRIEAGVQTSDETLGKGTGSCRDSAWLLCQVLRHLGLGSRFVSGYLVQLAADERPVDGPAGPLEDFTDLHAWTEVYIPGAGWIGLDPTSGLLAGEGHIPLAATPHYRGAAAVTGAIDPCEATLEYANTVTRILETPRTTQPYRPDQWAAANAVGAYVDQRLTEMDVRLTVGGEPTFVATNAQEAPEWNTDADGDEKRRLAEELVAGMRAELAPGGLLHVGQGKWYPGEPLPRWARTVFYRHDGEPIWADDRLTAGPTGPAVVEDGEAFANALAANLGGAAPDSGVEDASAGVRVIWAYEDPVYHLWQEASLPIGVENAEFDPQEAVLSDALHRARLARILDGGLSQPAGFVLPIGFAASGWVTSPWRFKRDQLFVLPGDSPVGLRLPLARLQVDAEPVQAAAERDPFDPSSEPFAPPGIGQIDALTVAGTVSTAICVEVREGVVYIFMPPVATAQAYLTLIDVVARTAAELDQPVRIEGYDPPSDPRLGTFAITPDPGVIEVNLPTTSTWDEAKALTSTVFEVAKTCGLSAEKFDLDGRHTGTGGGNHLTLGGATAADSPFLRRPDLLASLITYWQHHPSLSYVFAGTFVGPTSQAPRVDEARHDALDELEIAFDQIDRAGAHPPFWLVDRALRHLLVDMTGNTHRAEFCIDKLYPPEIGGRRLGVVELRGFEMPPHPEMSLIQQLLVRAIVARCWEHPYREPLVRWGTRLHDEFLLPHFAVADLADVCRDLRSHGYDIDESWFEPFIEFRFPRIGAIRVDDVTLELRRALEPWPVLGEELTASGTARAVDSSMERIQVEVIGAIPGRHTVTCNGRALALHPSGQDGRFVGGVRFRAWAPPSSLHPLLPADSTLIFDIVDVWSQRAIGGCRYHVSHPGGRVYDTAPVNENEAAGRRVARFWEFGHQPQPARTLGSSEVARADSFRPVGSPPGPLRAPVLESGATGFSTDLRRTPKAQRVLGVNG